MLGYTRSFAGVAGTRTQNSQGPAAIRSRTDFASSSPPSVWLATTRYRRTISPPVPRSVAPHHPPRMVWAKVTEGRVPPSVQMTTDVGSLRSLTRISGRRRDVLRTLLTRKTPPKGTAGFVAANLADHAEIVAQVGGNHLAADLGDDLGVVGQVGGHEAGGALRRGLAGEQRAQPVPPSSRCLLYTSPSPRDS